MCTGYVGDTGKRGVGARGLRLASCQHLDQFDPLTTTTIADRVTGSGPSAMARRAPLPIIDHASEAVKPSQARQAATACCARRMVVSGTAVPQRRALVLPVGLASG